MPESSKAAASKKDTQAMSRQQAAAVAE